MTTGESAGDRVIQLATIDEFFTVVHEHVRARRHQRDEAEAETRNAVFELRVHGVSGTPPASMLGIRPDQVGRVTRDQVTGFYRALPDVKLPNRERSTRDSARSAGGRD